MEDSRPTIVPLSGFLGAGKTTLILAAAKVLRSQGIRAAAILNDQGSELVDTHLAEQNGLLAGQVTGGCFCCRFSDLVEAAEQLHAYQPEVIFAEAVGSCTDLSATTLQPLRRYHADQFRLAPFTVLVDPGRARELMVPSADPDLAYLFHNQIAEADVVCFTKRDIESTVPDLPGLPVRSLSAATGQGVAEWLHEILGGELPVRNTILEIDYGRYAQAEAALAWLNCRATVRLKTAQSPSMLAGPLLDVLCTAMAAENLRIAHLKLIDECASGYVKAALCGNDEEPCVEGVLDAEPCKAHDVLLNIRAVGDPDVLKGIVERALADIDASIRLLECFRPSAPRPQYRLVQ